MKIIIVNESDDLLFKFEKLNVSNEVAADITNRFVQVLNENSGANSINLKQEVIDGEEFFNITLNEDYMKTLSGENDFIDLEQKLVDTLNEVQQGYGELLESWGLFFYSPNDLGDDNSLPDIVSSVQNSSVLSLDGATVIPNSRQVKAIINKNPENFIAYSGDTISYDHIEEDFSHTGEEKERMRKFADIIKPYIPYTSANILSCIEYLESYFREPSYLSSGPSVLDSLESRSSRFGIDAILRAPEFDPAARLSSRALLLGAINLGLNYIEKNEVKDCWLKGLIQGLGHYVESEEGDDKLSVNSATTDQARAILSAYYDGFFAGTPGMENFDGIHPHCHGRLRNLSRGVTSSLGLYFNPTAHSESTVESLLRAIAKIISDRARTKGRTLNNFQIANNIKSWYQSAINLQFENKIFQKLNPIIENMVNEENYMNLVRALQGYDFAKIKNFLDTPAPSPNSTDTKDPFDSLQEFILEPGKPKDEPAPKRGGPSSK